jgi:Lon protease-like protein
VSDLGSERTTSSLPIFPLGGVLFPFQLLPLHIFEPRYRVLMDHLTAPAANPELGVVLITRGHEVGGGDERVDTGTRARLVQAEALPDGRWLALFLGVRRLQVVRWQPDDPYPQAEVVDLPDPPWRPSQDAMLATAEASVRRATVLASELGEGRALDGELPPDRIKAAWTLCAAAPLGALDRQRLLEADDDSRLALLAEEAAGASEMLAFRLGAG